MKKSTSQNDKSLKSSLIVAICFGCVFVIALVIFILSRTVIPAETVSKLYTDGIFYYISWPIKKAISYFPFSFAEILLYVCVIAVPAAFIAAIIRTVSRIHEQAFFRSSGERKPLFRIFKPFIRFLLSTATLIFILGSSFILFGGINYNGLTFAEKAGYTTEEYSVSQLRDLCAYIASEATQARNALVLKRDGMIDDGYIEYNLFKLTDDAVSAYAALPDRFAYLKRDYPPAKPAIGSVIMSNIHITGIYPYIVPEAIVNAQTPIMSLPHTICHEMAHQRGFAREDEANYIGYLTCVNSDNPLFVYSGYYTAFSYAMDQLHGYDADAWNEIAASVDAGVWLDMAAENEFWDQFKTIDNNFTSSVNNTYLTVMNVDDGVHSYGRMVDLLIADAIERGIIE